MRVSQQISGEETYNCENAGTGWRNLGTMFEERNASTNHFDVGRTRTRCSVLDDVERMRLCRKWMPMDSPSKSCLWIAVKGRSPLYVRRAEKRGCLRDLDTYPVSKLGT